LAIGYCLEVRGQGLEVRGLHSVLSTQYLAVREAETRPSFLLIGKFGAGLCPANGMAAADAVPLTRERLRELRGGQFHHPACRRSVAMRQRDAKEQRRKTHLELNQTAAQRQLLLDRCDRQSRVSQSSLICRKMGAWR